MDLRQSKPVHLRCPKCGHDYAVNTNRIEEDYANAKTKVASLKSEIERLKAMGYTKKSPAYKRISTLYADAQAQCAAIKKVRKALNTEMELQKYEIFKDLVKGILGNEKTIELLQEVEEEMTFREYETAVQKYNRFDGV